MASFLERAQEMLSNIFEESEIFAALETSWNNNKDFLELFSCAWDLEELHKNLPHELILADKSDAEADKLRDEGNEAYRVQDLDKALHYYNRSIMASPHPLLSGLQDHCDSQEDEECLGRQIDPAAYGGIENGVCETLAKGYANRSAVLVELKCYEACLSDIEKAYECGYPKHLRPKMETRRAKCIAALRPDSSKKSSGGDGNASGSSKKLDDKNSWIASFAEALGPLTLKDLLVSPQREAPTLDEPNPAIPALSNAVQVANVPGKGRGLIAARDILTGEILGVERAYSVSINVDNLQEYCSTCLRRCLTPLPCPGCNRVIFCTEYCRAKGLSEEHWLECLILPTVEEMNADNKCMVYKILKNSSINQLRKVYKKVTDLKYENPEEVGQNAEGIYKSEAYHTVHHLCGNLNEQSIWLLTIQCKFAVILIKLLELTGRFFVDETGRPIPPSREDAVLTGAVLVSHAVKLNYNPYEVIDLQLKRSIAAGIFPALSLINHSCAPVTKHYNMDRYIILRAVKPIKAGEEITDTYSPNFSEKDKETRGKHLKNYFIDCNCIACRCNWPVYDKLAILTLKCQRCVNEPVIAPNTMCAECVVKASPTRTSPAVLKERQAVAESMWQAIYKAIRIGMAMGNSGEISDDEFKYLCSSVDLLHEHVALPCQTIVDMENILLRAYELGK